LRDADLWRISLDSESGREPKRAIRCGGEECIPAVSADGSALFYSRIVKDTVEFVRHNFRSGTDERAASSKNIPIYPFVVGPQAFPVYASGGGKVHVLRAYNSQQMNAACSGCILFWDVSSSGRYALAMAGGDVRRIDLFKTQSETRDALVSHPQWNLYWGAFSPDEKEIVSCAK